MKLARGTAVAPEVADLLALAMWPDPERVQARLERYIGDPALQVWVWMDEGQPRCAAGLRVVTGRPSCCTSERGQMVGGRAPGARCCKR